MPNGGSDCCGTCWFNRANRGKRGSSHHNSEIPSYCEIRELAIPNPFYTYCANHPYRRPQRDPIPIGPVTVHRAEVVETEPGRSELREGRFDWQPSPDTKEIRLHLLALLEDPSADVDEGYHFFAGPAVSVALDQLIQFRELRTIPILERLVAEMESSGDDPSELRQAIDLIIGREQSEED